MTPRAPRYAARGRRNRKRVAGVGRARGRLRPPPLVAVATDAAAGKFTLLAGALAQAGLWTALESRVSELGVDRAQLRIVIKPDMTIFDVPSPAGTDPELVEELIDELHDHGYTSVVAGSTRDTFDLLLENRGVLALADLSGYRFRTRRERDYDIVDLAEDTVPGAFAEGAALFGSEVSRVWSEAHFRVSFCKNRTDECDYYSLSLQNLIGILPLTDKLYHYRQRLRAPEVVADLLRTYPPHFAIIDAFTSSHGSAGARACAAIETRGIIASTDALAADCVAARKMGLDPEVSELTAYALRAFGRPATIDVAGDDAVYPGWRNVHPVLAGAARGRHRFPAAAWLMQALLQTVNRELFPFKDLTTDRLNQLFVRWAGDPDATPLAFWLTAILGYGLGAAGGTLEAWRVIAAKDALTRAELALGIDPDDYANDEYDAVREYVLSMRPLLDGVPPDAEGLRWTYLEHSQLFEVSRVIAVPFEAFVSRVDVSLANQFMNDYIGGRIVAKTRDEDGRPLRQAERDLYLPQPNFMALSDGKYIDVMKIECAEYLPERHTLYWRLVKSENDSAAYDDALVSFERTDDGSTRITIFGRQEFSIPPVWSLIDLPVNAGLKRFLVTDAYHRFFARSFANFEAVAEGRDVRLGHALSATRGEPGGDETPSLQVVGETLEKLLTTIPADGVTTLKQWITGDDGQNAGGVVDDDGFVHFQGRAALGIRQAPEPSARENLTAFFKDVADALRRDFAQ